MVEHPPSQRPHRGWRMRPVPIWEEIPDPPQHTDRPPHAACTLERHPGHAVQRDRGTSQRQTRETGQEAATVLGTVRETRTGSLSDGNRFCHLFFGVSLTLFQNKRKRGKGKERSRLARAESEESAWVQAQRGRPSTPPASVPRPGVAGPPGSTRTPGPRAPLQPHEDAASAPRSQVRTREEGASEALLCTRLLIMQRRVH